MILVFLAGVSAVAAVTSVWTRSQLRDEDTWAATSEALLDDPLVRQDVADALAVQVMESSGVQDMIEGVLPGPLGLLADPLAGRATELLGQATLQLVETEFFADAWDRAVRASHAELLAALDGEGRFTQIGEQGIELDLGSTLTELRQVLNDRGVTIFDAIDLDSIDVQFLLIDAPGIERVRDVLDVLDILVVVLPIVAVGLAVVGLLVARRRAWAVTAGGVGGLVAVIAVSVLVEGGRGEAVDQLSGGILGRAAARAVVDHVTTEVDHMLVVSAVVAAGVVLVGAVASLATLRRP
ncbi:MAG TPA: hypothetical protein VIY72_05230 [Acidimicrobiales bacterium]